MKKIRSSAFLTMIMLMASLAGFAQQAPVWTHSINTLPDTAFLFPVKTGNDGNNNVYVLSNYQKNLGAGLTSNKIYLNKYNSAGSLTWGLVYDNNGSGDPHGFDMAVDNAGNCFIAGGLMAGNQKPLLLKVNTGGNVTWQRDSTTTFNTGYYNQLILKNNLLYVKASNGIAVFDLNGSEQWSHANPALQIAVDNAGQMIVSSYLSGLQNIFRYDAAGILNFADSTLEAKRIATDAVNSFYLLADLPNYELVKYDSAGNFQWVINNFYSPPSFGDIGMDVLIDNNNDVLVVGLADSMFKFSPSGNKIWGKSMNGLDSYIISPRIIAGNFLAVGGTINGFSGYDISVVMYDGNGNQSWSGYYNSNFQQEFTVDIAADNSAIYLIEDSISSTTLMKFDLFQNGFIDYSLICVDSVWYDPGNPNFINVSVFNGNINHLNYPSVQIVSPLTGDTISNPQNLVNFFAHLGNTYQTYYDTITVQGIPDFSNYIFLISEGFGDTTVAIGWCNTTGMPETTGNEFSMYPNPAVNQLTVKYPGQQNRNAVAEIYNCVGAKVLEKKLSMGSVPIIEVSGLSQGIYFLQLLVNGRLHHFRFIKD